MRTDGCAQVRAIELQVGDHTHEALTCGPEDGRLVLFLHGFPTTEAMWRPVLRELGGRGWRAVAPRQRGYAPRAQPSGRTAYAIDHLVEDVLGFADALGVERFHLVGHDWGGIVGWMAASAHPERIRSFCSLSTPHPAALARSMRGVQAARSAYVGLFQLPVVPELLLGAAGRSGLRIVLQRSGLPSAVARGYADSLDAHSLHHALDWYRQVDPMPFVRADGIRVPTLFVWGRRDPALGRAAAEATTAFVLGPYRFVELDASHWLVESRCADVTELIDDHLRTQPAA